MDVAGGVSTPSGTEVGVARGPSAPAGSKGVGVGVEEEKGIVASGGGEPGRVAPAMSAVVSDAKWPDVIPPVRQRM